MTPDLVSLVIPARNAAATLPQCLDAILPIADRGELGEVIVVDDGSTDDTARIAESYEARVIRGEGRGPAAARNLGWRAARGALIWFIDSDCVAEPDALSRLVSHLGDTAVGGAGGSYGIMNPESRLACLIHEEIAARHARMPVEVDYLATFNVLYRHRVLERLDGFDERLKTAEDADFSFRVQASGYGLRFDRESRVRHFHPTRWWAYLRTQRMHGYWRVWLYRRHGDRAGGDAYSGLIDHLQPPLAIASLAMGPLVFVPALRWASPAAMLLLLLAQVPMTLRILLRTRRRRYLWFAPMGFFRAYSRGVGLVQGIIAVLYRWVRDSLKR